MATEDDSSKVDNEAPNLAFLARLIVPAVKAARASLSVDEGTFRLHTFHAAPRAFFLYTALDEALKAALFVMKLDGFLDDGEPLRAIDGEPDPTERCIEAVLLEESHLRVRRLCELLSQLVLFCQKDEERLYSHLLLLEEFVQRAFYERDLDTFHGISSAWIRISGDLQQSELHAIEPSVPEADAWYANRYKRPARKEDAPRLLSSARQRLMLALPLMTDVERMTLGTTYDEAFGTPSSVIHYRGAADPVDHSRKSVVVTLGKKVEVLALCVLSRVYILLGAPSIPALEQVARVVSTNSEATRLLASLSSRPNVQVGDFVVARGYLGQVMDARTTSFGYRSVNVDLLVERPLDQLPADWFRIRDVALVFSRVRLVEQIRSLIGTPDAVVPNETLRSSAIEAWNLGLREQISRSRNGST